MAAHPRPPALNLTRASTPASPITVSQTPLHRSQSPFRYIDNLPQSTSNMDHKSSPSTSDSVSDQKRPPSPRASLHPISHQRCSTYSNGSPTSPLPPRSTSLCPQSHLRGLPAPPPLLIPSHRQTPSHARLRITSRLRPFIPLMLYGFTSLAFLVAIAFWRTELFSFLDQLSHWLRRDEDFGHAVLFFLIFLTTFPPLPLYSTLIILSGYTFGPYTGAIISYCAALTGALTVFIISRSLLRDSISRWLASTVSIKRVVRAIEKSPKLLFLIRLAPYPYNVMNCLLAASPTLTLRTYTLCTALSLFKVIIHTSLGASIHSFKDYHVVPDDDGQNLGGAEEESGASTVARAWTVVGISMCILIFIYLSIIARRAIDQELDEDESATVRGETIAFLSPSDLESGNGGTPMVESPLQTHPLQVTR